MKRLLWLFPALLCAQSPALDLIIGAWNNENPDTRGITRVVVRRGEAGIVAHAWGACSPVDCDWGDANVTVWNGIPVAKWEHGFSTHYLQFVPQQDGRLVVAVRPVYHDGSGRPQRTVAEPFVLEAATEGDAGPAAALLQRVADVYRNLAAARFDATETALRTGARAQGRMITDLHITALAPDKVRIDVEGRGEPEILIGNGASFWRVFPKVNEYLKTSSATVLRYSPVFHYAEIDKNGGVWRITGAETVADAACTVLQLERPRRIRKLWVDEATYLIRKDSTETTGTSGPDTFSTETIYTKVELGEPVDPATFTYDAARAKERPTFSTSGAETLTGRMAPDFTLQTLDGRDIRLSDLRGQPVLLDFWAVWCGYCRQSLPTVELLHRTFQEKGLHVFGVDSEPEDTARDYLLKNGYTVPSLIDPDNRVARLYQVRGWPTTVLIDADGRVVFHETGFSAEAVRDALRKAGMW